MKSSRLALISLGAASASLFAWASGCSAASGGISGGAGASQTGSTSTGRTNSGTASGLGNGGASSGTASGQASGGANSSSSGIILTTTSNSSSSGTPCTGLECQIHACTPSTTPPTTTTITGTIYDPAGKNPLYGVVAYVPNSAPRAITSGAECTSCSDLYTGDPIAAAVTDADGNFTITNAPDGANIPLVIQVGKWRRQFTLPTVTRCGSTAVPSGTLTLPKNGSEGDLPNIAISTGSADTLECLLVRIGVDPAEYVPGPSASGHIHIFQGPNGPNTSPSAPVPQQSLWDSSTDIMKYDIVLLSCEGQETENMNQEVLFNYAAAGGRVFASHFHYAWFNTGPFGGENLAKWTTGSQSIGNVNASVVTTDWAGTAFARGQAMHDWLQNVNALTNNLLPVEDARDNATVASSNTPSQPWLVVDGTPTEPQDFTFDTPIGVDAGAQCGRVAFSDMHVGAGDGDYMGGRTKITPTGCAMVDLSPQEKALEFIFFDLASCVTPNNMVQPPPPPPPPTNN